MAFTGNIIARVGANITPLQNGLNNANRSLSQFQRSASTATIAIGNLMANMAQKAIAAVGQMSTDAIKNYNMMESANLGLKSILEAQGKSFQQAQGFLKDYVNDGLIPLTDATAAFKQLSAAGYNLDQTEKILLRLKDASAFGRQASLTMGEAVRSATEGIKNENSILVNYLPSHTVMMAA